MVRTPMVEFPGHPRSRTRLAEKTIWAPDEIQQRRQMLTHHALLVTEEGARGVASQEDATEIIGYNFDPLRYEYHVFKKHHEPFIVLFLDRAVRDAVFVKGKIFDGPVELRFHTWDVDRRAERTLLPYHVKISIEGLPQHAWFLK
jgi:hypothetical protein